VDHRHCWLRGGVKEVVVESFWHCAVRNGDFSFLKDLEKEERRLRLGTMAFDMIAAVSFRYGTELICV
jgi:hypothetical protein